MQAGTKNSLTPLYDPDPMVETQRHRIDPVNYCKVRNSQRQTATQGNTRVGREMGNPNQTVTRSEDMDPGIGPEGKQDLRRTPVAHLVVHWAETREVVSSRL